MALKGDEFLSAGISVSAAPSTGSCEDAVAALILAGTFKAQFTALGTAQRSEVANCNRVPVTVTFTQTVRQVTVVFAGESASYQLKVYDTSLNQIGSVQKTVVDDGTTFQIGYSDSLGSRSIRRITFGSDEHLTLVKEIRYQR